MTKKLIILLLFASLSGLAQTQKGDWVVSPQFRVLPWGFVSNDFVKSQLYKIDIPIHYYLSNKLSFGLNISSQYSHNNYSKSTIVQNDVFSIGISPELQYNFSKKRLVPFIKLFPVLYFGTTHQKIENPLGAINQQRPWNYDIRVTPLILNLSVGLNYLINERFGIYGAINWRELFQDSYYAKPTFNIGCQYIFSRRKQQEQKLSPRAF